MSTLVGDISHMFCTLLQGLIMSSPLGGDPWQLVPALLDFSPSTCLFLMPVYLCVLSLIKQRHECDCLSGPCGESMNALSPGDPNAQSVTPLTSAMCCLSLCSCRAGPLACYADTPHRLLPRVLFSSLGIFSPTYQLD